MTSQAQASAPLPGVRGLAFLGFPLHPAGRPSQDRAKHLFDVQIPMLFLQGTRDTLAALDQLEPLCQALGHARDLEAIRRTPIIRSTCRRGPAARTRTFAREMLDALAALDRRRHHSPSESAIRPTTPTTSRQPTNNVKPCRET